VIRVIRSLFQGSYYFARFVKKIQKAGNRVVLSKRGRISENFNVNLK
jgi:hypothetical protein